LEHGVLRSKQLTERFLFVSSPLRFSVGRGRRIQRKMERALVPRRREAVLGFKNAPQLGQVGSFGLGPCHDSDSGSENSSIKKASGNLVRPSAASKFKLSHLQRSLSTPINHCGGNPASRCALEHTRRPAAPPLAASKPGSFGALIDPRNAKRRLSGI
jgi:hypothetical protein